MTLRDHTLAWLDSIGADGLMTTKGAVKGDVITKEEFADFSPDAVLLVYRVPAYRHADGSYHPAPELVKPCDKCTVPGCTSDDSENCESFCKWHKQWLANNEPPSAARR